MSPTSTASSSSGERPPPRPAAARLPRACPATARRARPPRHRCNLRPPSAAPAQALGRGQEQSRGGGGGDRAPHPRRHGHAAPRHDPGQDARLLRPVPRHRAGAGLAGGAAPHERRGLQLPAPRRRRRARPGHRQAADRRRHGGLQGPRARADPGGDPLLRVYPLALPAPNQVPAVHAGRDAALAGALHRVRQDRAVAEGPPRRGVRRRQRGEAP